MYPEFVELVRKHDILCVCETKLDKEDVISCDGYTFINEPRKQAYYRKSGGLGLFIRDNLIKFVEILRSTTEYISWIKISKQLLKTEDDLLLGTVYIPPQQSRFFNEDELELLDQEITSSMSSYKNVCIMGDFNAQTSDLADYTLADNFLTDHFDFDQETIEYFDQRSILEKHGIQVARVSSDKKKNNSGFRLIDLCKNTNLFILNGRYGQDRDIGAMTFRDVSVIDYTLVSANLFNHLHDFSIGAVDSLLSDGHSLLCLDISLNGPKPNHQKHERKSKTHSMSFIKPNEYECFIENFNQASVDQILYSLQLCNNSTITKDSVNYIASQINNAFHFSAKKVLNAKPSSQIGRNENDRPWFGYQCKNARKKYHLARRKHNIFKTESSKIDLTMASRFLREDNERTYKEIQKVTTNQT